MIKKVIAKQCSGWNMSIMQLFGSGPKLKIQCGECGGWFSKRVMMVNRPTVLCPFCKIMNILPITVD
jgi:hypothetical protein